MMQVEKGVCAECQEGFYAGDDAGLCVAGAPPQNVPGCSTYSARGCATCQKLFFIDDPDTSTAKCIAFITGTENCA